MPSHVTAKNDVAVFVHLRANSTWLDIGSFGVEALWVLRRRPGLAVRAVSYEGMQLQLTAAGIRSNPTGDPALDAALPFPERSDIPVATVEGVAYCAVFLAGDDAGYLTGQIIHPSGGWVIG